MSLFIEVQTVGARRGPERALILNCRFRWNGFTTAFLLGLGGRLQFNNRVLSERVGVESVNWSGTSGVALIERDRDYHGSLSVPLSNEAIYLVDRERGSNDITLQLDVRYQWQEAIPASRQQGNRNENFVAGPVHWETHGTNWQPIARSTWLQRLADLGWSETELFEVRALPLLGDPNLEAALGLVRDAEAALRLGDYKGVLVKCRNAFESAAKYESQGDTRKGFALLLARAFPEQNAKCSALDKVIGEFSNYAQVLGRHEQYPALHVSRAEAEFALVVTLGLFSLLSRHLKGEGVA